MRGSASHAGGAPPTEERRDSRDELRWRVVYALVVALRFFFSRIPEPWALRIGATLGRLHAWLGGWRIPDGLINLKIAFPDRSAAERRRVLVQSCANWGRSLAEVALLHGPQREQVLARTRLDIDDHLNEARRISGQDGVILLTAHFGAWELAGAQLSRQGYPLTVVYREPDNPYLDRLVRSSRERFGTEVLALGEAALGTLRALRRGRLVAMLLDQNASLREGVFAPFFSLPASTRAAPAAIALRRRLAVLPVFTFREGNGHVLRSQPPLFFDPPGSDPAADLRAAVAHMNRAIEAAILEAPDHWVWAHRRWRTRPEGDSSRIYPTRRTARSLGRVAAHHSRPSLGGR